MPHAAAFANNDVVQIVWSYDAKIAGCLGFAIERQDQSDPAKNWVPLNTWVGFQGANRAEWTATSSQIDPVQKFDWLDVEAKRDSTYRYRVTPMLGTPGALNSIGQAGMILLTDPVTVTPDRGPFKTYFNRGILSTQFVAHAIPAGPSGAPNYQVLDNRIDQPGDPLRASLAGQIIEGVTLLLDRAKTQGGTCYLALYELNDPELIQALLAMPSLHLILSNTGTDDAENQPARQSLHEKFDGKGDSEVIDRFVPSGHIGHNKFCVYVDTTGKPQAVLLGSTNWTDTALCAQSNNALIAENPSIAQTYFAYWGRLKDDSRNDNSKQGSALRQSNQTASVVDLGGDGQATIWFSPNADDARSSTHSDEAAPLDLSQVFALMNAAKRAILFLEFEPGHPSVVDEAAKIATANPDLFVRGATTDTTGPDAFTALFHRHGDKVEVVAATEVKDQFGAWQKELLKSGPNAHAIIHDKIVVIDPSTPDCVVITGSHNQGYRASYNNDENLMIVQGNRALAQAYAVHVMDIYGHYHFRSQLQIDSTAAFNGLKTDDGWQDGFFADNGAMLACDTAVWF